MVHQQIRCAHWLAKVELIITVRTLSAVPGGGGACYDPETAKGLPPFVFDCSKPKAAVARA